MTTNNNIAHVPIDDVNNNNVIVVTEYDDDDGVVVLGIDGGTTSTICVCMPFDQPLNVLGRAIAGCSNHNSVGGTSFSLFHSLFFFLIYFEC